MDKDKTAGILINLRWPVLVILIAAAIDYQFYGASWPELGSVATFLARLVFGLQIFGLAVAMIGWSAVMKSAEIARNQNATASLLKSAQTSTWATKEHYTHLLTVLAVGLAGHPTIAIWMLALDTVFRLWVSYKKASYLRRNAYR